MYNWIKKYGKEIGLGRSEDGGIDGHNDQWWKDKCQGKYSECKKFKWGMPTYIDQLHEMFHGTNVDGSTACIPGEDDWGPSTGADEEDNNDDEDEDEEEPIRSPGVNSDNRKRTRSSTDTASSPKKKSKGVFG